MQGSPGIDELIESAFARPTQAAELQAIVRHVAAAGFSPAARERVRGRLAGTLWQGHRLRGSDMLSPDVVHYLWHVVHRREWPDGTSLADYVESLRAVILDPNSGILVGRYQGAAQLAVIRESRDLRGANGHEWVCVQYRVGYGNWVTGYQPQAGLAEFEKPQWSAVQWLRQPMRSNA
jgi:hypothetical protein